MLMLESQECFVNFVLIKKIAPRQTSSLQRSSIVDIVLIKEQHHSEYVLVSVNIQENVFM